LLYSRRFPRCHRPPCPATGEFQTARRSFPHGRERRRSGKERLFGLLAIIGAIVAALTFWRRRGDDDDDFDDDDDI